MPVINTPALSEAQEEARASHLTEAQAAYDGRHLLDALKLYEQGTKDFPAKNAKKDSDLSGRVSNPPFGVFRWPDTAKLD